MVTILFNLFFLNNPQKRAPVKFEIACATVDPQTDSFDPSPLIPYVQSLGVTYHYLSEPIVELAKSKLQVFHQLVCHVLFLGLLVYNVSTTVCAAKYSYANILDHYCNL